MADGRTRRIAVVGGGITGLAAAWEACGHDGIEVSVVESAPRFGGKIATSPLALSSGPITVDEGADAFLARVPDGLELCRELGIDTELVSPATGRAQVFVNGELKELPTTSVLGVPLDFDDLAASGIVSPDGVARAAQEIDRTDPPLDGDAAIGAFLAERYGREVVDHLVGPLIGGINAGDVDRLSLRAVTPQLAEAATHGGSLTEALRRTRAAGPPQGPVFLAPVGGTGRLVDALVEGCRGRGATLHTDSLVTDLGDLDVDGIVLTSPARPTATLVRPLCAEAADELDGIAQASVVLTTMVFDRTAVADDVHSGFLIPRDAGLTLTAVSYGSNKWPQWDDGTHMIVRASAGHAGDDRTIDLDDDQLVAALLADLRTTAGITAEPITTRISRYRDGFAQYEVGHLERVDRIERALRRQAPHVRIAGATQRGVGIPACIRQGRSAVRELLGEPG